MFYPIIGIPRSFIKFLPSNTFAFLCCASFSDRYLTWVLSAVIIRIMAGFMTHIYCSMPMNGLAFKKSTMSPMAVTLWMISVRLFSSSSSPRHSF